MMFKSNKKVYIVGGGLDFTRMFTQRKWDITQDLFSCDLIQLQQYKPFYCF